MLVRDMEPWVALANRLNDLEEPLQDDITEWNRDDTEHSDRAQAHHHPLCLRRRRKFESAHDPLLVRHDDQQNEDQCSPNPVQYNEYPQRDVRNRQRS